MVLPEPVGASGASAPTNGVADPSGSADHSLETPAPDETTIGDPGSDRFRSYHMENPAIAVEKMIEYQSDRDRVANELRSYREKVGDLDPFVEKLGGERIAGLLANYGTLRSHPVFGQHLLALEQGGTLPASLAPEPTGDDGEDEYVDPDVKALREQLAETQQTLAALQGEVGAHSSRASMSDFKAHVTSVFDDWQDLTGEDRELVQKSMEGDIAGLPPKTVSSLDKNGVETLFIKHMVKHGLFDQVSQRRFLRREQERTAASTDVPATGVVSSGVEKPTARPTALEAFREATELAKAGRL